MSTQIIIPMKRHDLLPVLRLRLFDDDNPSGIDLTAATEVRFIARNRAGVKINALMTKEDQTASATKGVVRYAWVAADTDTAGDFSAEVQVMWPGSKPQTWPEESAVSPTYMIFRVHADLGP